MALKTIVLILSLGIDTLMVSVGLGMRKTTGKLKIAFAFATAEAVMPLLGFAIGRVTGHWIGDWAAVIGGLVLIGLSVWMIFLEDEDDEGQVEKRMMGWSLVVTAISISLDELAVGFSIGLVGVPVVLTIFLVAVQAFVFTFIGLTFGASLRRYLGEWAEKMAGIVLGLLGLWIFLDALLYVF